jgi:hypothetical protein
MLFTKAFFITLLGLAATSFAAPVEQAVAKMQQSFTNFIHRCDRNARPGVRQTLENQPQKNVSH